MHKRLNIQSFIQTRRRALWVPAAWVVVATVLWFCSLWRHGYGSGGVFSLVFIGSLLILAWWDLKTRLLLDVLTYPLIIVGLVLNTLVGGQALTSPFSALSGAFAGYGLLWIAYAYFLWRTGQEGIGQGDFKFAAGIGAWLGLQAVAGTLLIAACAGLIVGLVRRMRGTLVPGEEIAFGPFLAAGGLIMLLLP